MPEIELHKLRDLFEIWIIPMLNPDGVVLGNFEGNYQGKNLGLCCSSN